MPCKGSNLNKTPQGHYMNYFPQTCILPGSHIVHPFTLLNYKGFSESTLDNLHKTLVRLEEGASIRSLYNSTPKDKTEEEFLRLLILTPININQD